MRILRRLGSRWTRLPMRRRVLTVGGVVIVATVCPAVVLNVVGSDDGLSLIDGSRPTRSYPAVFLLVFLDAVVPIFPGETTLTPRPLPPRWARSSSGR